MSVPIGLLSGQAPWRALEASAEGNR